MWESVATIIFIVVVVFVLWVVYEWSRPTPEIDQQAVDAIIAQTEASKQKLKRALEADPPASTQSGDTSKKER